MSFLVVFADDFIAGFEQKEEAERFYREMQERLAKFGLEIEKSKSRLVEFGRYARERRKRRGLGKPETFNFLGFTFYCGKTSKGKFCVIPKTNTSAKGVDNEAEPETVRTLHLLRTDL